jgi:hypothetical protein
VVGFTTYAKQLYANSKRHWASSGVMPGHHFASMTSEYQAWICCMCISRKFCLAPSYSVTSSGYKTPFREYWNCSFHVSISCWIIKPWLLRYKYIVYRESIRSKCSGNFLSFCLMSSHHTSCDYKVLGLVLFQACLYTYSLLRGVTFEVCSTPHEQLCI